MALSKIQAESMNLADTYAFSGTVSGTPSDMKLLLNETISSSIGQYDISSTYINSTYDTYYLDASFRPESDSKLLYMKPFVGGVISDSGLAYANFNIDTGQRVFSDSTTNIRCAYNAVGNANGESISLNGYLQNINSTTIPWCFSGMSNYYMTNGYHGSNCVTGGYVVANRALVVNGLRLLFSGSNIQEGTVKLYGLRK
tara:strand:- start:320 stop:916 length:597 start_codon:yes stop_codon:yes gene_type:complete